MPESNNQSIMSRLLPLIVQGLITITIPVAGYFALDISTTLHDIQTQQSETYVLLREAIEPRVLGLEQDISNIEARLESFSNNRFTDQDGDRLRIDLERQIRQLEVRIERLEQ